jgi:hypothetical protein
MHHVREGKHGARSAKQAIAIGLSKARRAGVKLRVRAGTRDKAEEASVGHKPSTTRSRATRKALKKEGRSAALAHRAVAPGAQVGGQAHCRKPQPRPQEGGGDAQAQHQALGLGPGDEPVAQRGFLHLSHRVARKRILELDALRHLEAAISPLRRFMMSVPVRAHPGLRTTNAATTSPKSGSGIATTADSSTPSIWSMRSSISFG